MLSFDQVPRTNSVRHASFTPNGEHFWKVPLTNVELPKSLR
jgi:hypothetical protein